MENVKMEQPLSNNLIGVMGRKSAGKDTIAEHLIEEYGFVRYAFADPIKKACQIIFGFTDEQCWGGLKDTVDEYWNVTPRKVFQLFGTELFQYDMPRHIVELSDMGRRIWVFVFARWYEQQIAKNPHIKVVITDIRFPFEAEMVQRLGGTIIKVARVGQIYDDMHASEVEMDEIPYSYLLENDGTVDDLHLKVDQLFSLMF